MKKLIQFKNIVKSFDNQIVLRGINLDIYENEFVTLLGPSGCGKTTLLRILGGFLDADEGHIIIDGEDISEVPAYERDINTVFQKYALFPHLNVYENIAFGLRIKKMSEDIIEQKVKRMLSLVGLDGYSKRDVTLLSGGQQQRVAIARALVNEPNVLLLDEPLGALDLKLRKEMQLELKRIQQEVGITFIFVTHDQEEALTMSDKIVVMKDGEIQQIGTPIEIYNEPINEYVAKFIGESNIMDGIMKKDYLVNWDDQDYVCVDQGFKTASGTSKTVTMHVLGEKDVINESAKEKISASNFYMDLEDVSELSDADVIARANAQAWTFDDEDVSLSSVEYDVKEAVGTYPCTFKTSKGTKITINIAVVEPIYTEDAFNEEAVQAFDFYKTVDEIKESIALDTDLKMWANAQAWSLEDESPVEIWDVTYDFDDEDIVEGDYQITFSTMGREMKIHTTEFKEEGQKVGLSFDPEDIHVMSKMGSY